MRAFLFGMKKIAIIKAGKTFEELRQIAGDFEDWIIRKSGFRKHHFEILPVSRIHEWPHPNQFRALIISGSHANVTENLLWMLKIKIYLQKARSFGLPILGICFGHQILAAAFGGRVNDNPNGDEFGSVRLHLTEEGKINFLFNELPFEFPIFMSHSQSVLCLPPKAQNLATTDIEAHGAFFLEPSVWGVQFHPEFDRNIMAWYLKRQYHIPESQIENYLHSNQNSPNIIKRFLELTI